MQRTMAKKYPRPIVETSHVEPELAGLQGPLSRGLFEF